MSETDNKTRQTGLNRSMISMFFNRKRRDKYCVFDTKDDIQQKKDFHCSTCLTAIFFVPAKCPYICPEETPFIRPPPGANPLYGLYSHVRPQRVRFLSWSGHLNRFSVLADFGHFGHK